LHGNHQIIDGTSTHLDEAARIWAEATSLRDSDPDIPPLEVARPVIQQVLDSSPDAFLLVALNANGEAAGFAAVAPDLPDEADAPCLAELHYLGVSPNVWGKGIGKALIGAISTELRVRGFKEARLSVYPGNTRAIRLYEHAGWQRYGDAFVSPLSGKMLQEYRLAL
jgi:ribosomal protein S18 acetylase RimI-like enzyme